ncbi:jg1450, partial [Pararge aegeria aegeria]
MGWWEALAVASYHPTDKDLPLSDFVFQCDVAWRHCKGITTILPN